MNREGLTRDDTNERAEAGRIADRPAYRIPGLSKRDHPREEGVRKASSEAAWATIQLVNKLGGTSVESYERLPEYGELVDLGVPPSSAADFMLRMIEPFVAEEAAHAADAAQSPSSDASFRTVGR